jgi:adenosylcobinamide-GDP ribazoletransferase
MPDAWRLTTGTLTAVRVAPPREVTRTTARNAMLLAPLAVLPLGALVAAVLWLGGIAGLPELSVAFIAVAALAAGSRALHWDGLSDVADGLTSGYDRERSLAVMKSGSSGPAGVVTTVLVVGIQVGALTAYVDTTAGALLAGLLVCLSRCALWIACCSRVPSARPGGLGDTFTRTVPVPVAVVGGLLLSVTGGLVVLLLVRRATARFGGVTGDVFGAAIELALATTLLTWAWL